MDNRNLSSLFYPHYSTPDVTDTSRREINRDENHTLNLSNTNGPKERQTNRRPTGAPSGLFGKSVPEGGTYPSIQLMTGTQPATAHRYAMTQLKRNEMYRKRHISTLINSMKKKCFRHHSIFMTFKTNKISVNL